MNDELKRIVGADGELIVEDRKPRKQKQRNTAALFAIVAVLGAFAVSFGIILGARTSRAPAPSVLVVPATFESVIDITPIPESILSQLTACPELLAEADASTLSTANMFQDVYNLFLYDANSGRTCMPALPGGRVEWHDPTLTRDAQRLFTIRYDRQRDVGELMVANADGSTARAIAPAISTGTGKMVWSPDGSELLYLSLDVPGGRDYTATLVNAARADGNGTRMIVQLPGSITMPTWSPDGKRIAFVRSNFGFMNTQVYSDPQLYVVNVQDGSATKVADLTPEDGWTWPNSPLWSEDGTRLIYPPGALGMDEITYTLS